MFLKTRFLSTFKRVYRSKFPRAHEKNYARMLKNESVAERFEEIYEKNLWRSEESGSGEGSELAYTEGLRPWVTELCRKYSVSTLVDAACGDFNWMSAVLPNVSLQYYGFDIVESIINKNNDKYASETVNFSVADIRQDPLPTCDVLMIRDCLFHLSFIDINKVLENISELNYKYLLTTSHTPSGEFLNHDIETGDFRWLDLNKHPLNFKRDSALEAHEEPPQGGMGREMVLFEKEHVPTRITH